MIISQLHLIVPLMPLIAAGLLIANVQILPRIRASPLVSNFCQAQLTVLGALFQSQNSAEVKEHQSGATVGMIEINLQGAFSSLVVQQGGDCPDHSDHLDPDHMYSGKAIEEWRWNTYGAQFSRFGSSRCPSVLAQEDLASSKSSLKPSGSEDYPFQMPEKSHFGCSNSTILSQPAKKYQIPDTSVFNQDISSFSDAQPRFVQGILSDPEQIRPSQF
jgi:hypothetical protein